MRFTALASIVLAAASAGLVNAATLEQRQLGSCSSSSLGLPLPLSQIIGTIPGLSNVLDILDATGLSAFWTDLHHRGQRPLSKSINRDRRVKRCDRRVL
ncbi:hypothetical protein DICSQDRAFT_136164 [Dichomitus squalens LYAD-421 SS1]|uniref:Hydrophobin n=1 Tax=Dichomitus squalens (strain LYAD-421) TaxID=732165 RepID=R7T126_DICSQ|nr:uncharacterized protein DICSQDRAFT_136164 [Dichomitus squalens LYAD-421 SS1]EJF62056.1 hypothetical protein DICSQDRAFT_136164 [Dichomitus squalens LYAD-421 SS1]